MGRVAEIKCLPSRSSRRNERLAIYLLVALYLFSAVSYDLATPFNEAPDELAHLVYMEHLVRYNSLPAVGKDSDTYESFQPPLYYLIGAGVILAVKALSGDERDGKLASPLRGNPAARTHTNPKAMLYLHPAEGRWPFWPNLVRMISILMGLGCVLLTYFTARVLIPSPASPAVAFMAGAFAALIPQVTFIHSSISNQVLNDLVAAWVGWLLVTHLSRLYSRRRVMWLGVALGLGLLTKLSDAELILPALWVLWIRRDSGPRSFLRDLGVVTALIFAVAGWFYIYRWAVYGDPLALKPWHAMLPPDNVFHLSDLFWFKYPFRWFLWSSFWGVFGWQTAWLPDWVYWIYLALTLLAVAGGVSIIARRILIQAQKEFCFVLLTNLLLSYGVVVAASTYLVAWQGREMFTALPSICILMALGLGGLVMGRTAGQPTDVSHARQSALKILAATVVVILLTLNVYALLAVVYPELSLGL